MRRELTMVAIATCALVPARPADACGPDFPPELLSRREAVLLELPDGIFADEATALAPAPAVRFELVDHPVEAEGLYEGALYGAGARGFHGGDLAAAERHFAAVLELPAPLRRHRSTFAAYMLGRLRHGAASAAAYQQVRALATAGFLDEGALAVSSLGQEARAHLWDGDTVGAVGLYAAQAAHGEPLAHVSLLIVVRDVIAGGRERELLADPLGQRLLAAYLYARADELDDEPRARVLAALAAVDGAAGTDRLAAAAYREGQWALAAQLIARAADTRLARRVRAKLALRDGDTATAARLLRDANASRSARGPAERSEPTPQVSGWAGDGSARDDDGAIARVRGERAALALAEGRMTDAMALAWDVRATYPEDALYLAERVLTIAELTGFLERLPPAGAPAAAYEYEWWTVTPAALRELLGRRLMRAGRYQEAGRYFGPVRRLVAWAYGEAMIRAGWSRDPIERARGLYQASRIARRDGLELLGTALAPDWGFYEAQYDLSEGREGEPADRWRAPAETARLAASAPPSFHRYHYRFTASALAEQAADLLPHQSQAFAATLCWSARHIASRDAERADALYVRYLQDGPSAVDMSFGQACPVPEFDRARRFLARPPAPTARWPFAIVVAMCAIAGALLARHLRPGRLVVRP